MSSSLSESSWTGPGAQALRKLIVHAGTLILSWSTIPGFVDEAACIKSFNSKKKRPNNSAKAKSSEDDDLVFHWAFIPWLQAELDAYRGCINFTAKRADQNKVLPHGVPAHMYEEPEAYECLDFKITLDPAISVQSKGGLHQPITLDPFLSLFLHHSTTTASNSTRACAHSFVMAGHPYSASILLVRETPLRSPTITKDNVWDVDLFILDSFCHLDDHADGPNVAAQFSDDEDSAPRGTYERELDLTDPDPFDW
ncbi:hypothetical protein C8J56DRAFT_898752 [Mycena floridula]|nr:hypothetical protein C8J56DRAFT_898752 [Mycena floridula]